MPNTQGEKGNKYLTDDVIVNEALLLLKNNLVAAKLVHRNLEKEFGKVGDSINLKLPHRTKSAEGRVLEIQPMANQTVPFTIDRQRHVGLEVTMRDRTLSIENFSETYLKSPVIQIANEIDRSVLMTLKRAYYSAGAAGTAPSRAGFLQAKAYMNSVAIPKDKMRRAIFNDDDAALISTELLGTFNEKFVKDSTEEGYVGPLAGFDTFESSNMPVHTVGEHGGDALLVAGADQSGATLGIDGGANSTTGLLVEGDVFTIADVYSVNPQTYQSTGRLQHFVVTADADTDGAGATTLQISPAINDGTTNVVNKAGEDVSLKAYQNVTAKPADNAPITVLGTSLETYRQNYLFHKNAIALAMVDLELPESATSKARVRDKESGLAMCMVKDFDIKQQTEITRIDAVWGAHMIDAALAMRYWSQVQ